ncbi:MAG TPA: hypothetical protein VFY68_10745 [Nitrososphaeraceae archaeon]|nr:hypothetical protein [Nitrososphaeraceae archaeon]
MADNNNNNNFIIDDDDSIESIIHKRIEGIQRMIFLHKKNNDSQGGIAISSIMKKAL